MIEVAVACEFPTLLGGERSMLAAATALATAGAVHFHAIVPPGDVAAAWAELGATVHLWAHLWASSRTPFEQTAPEARREQLATLLAKIRPDLVHANSLAMSRQLGPVVERLDLPSIGHLRDIVRLSKPAVADLNRHTRLLAVSDAVRQFHTRQGVDPGRLAVLYNGVDLSEFRPGEATGFLHRALGLPGDAKLIVSIGQVILRKGWDFLLNAAESVIRRDPNAHFIAVGGRHSPKAETQALAARIESAQRAGPLAGRWHMLGVRSDVAAILNEATVVAHAARQEPLGRVLLEAAASGRAVVATDVGGTREIFPDEGKGAVLVPVDRPAELAEAILELLASPGRREALGQSGRAWAEAFFDIRLRSQELLAHYHAIARRNR
jgi:glycosyltransferase involved in cell wall biosynthesis